MVYSKEDIAIDINMAYNLIIDYGFVRERNGKLVPTQYGRAVSMSFLNYEDDNHIKNSIISDKPLQAIDIATGLVPFENAYLSSIISQKLARALRANISSKAICRLNTGHTQFCRCNFKDGTQISGKNTNKPTN